MLLRCPSSSRGDPSNLFAFLGTHLFHSTLGASLSERGESNAKTERHGEYLPTERSAVWWVKYYRHGKPYRESTHKTNEKEAQDFLKQRLGEIVTGNFYGPKSERVRSNGQPVRDFRGTWGM